jgi:ferric-dicitrate binding protein FerR (iron transport regulator)
MNVRMTAASSLMEMSSDAPSEQPSQQIINAAKNSQHDENDEQYVHLLDLDPRFPVPLAFPAPPRPATTAQPHLRQLRRTKRALAFLVHRLDLVFEGIGGHLRGRMTVASVVHIADLG